MFLRNFIYLITFFYVINNFTQDITISYSILTHNETTSLSRLLKFLIKNKNINDEIIVIDDFSTNKKTLKILQKASKKNVKIYKHHLNHNFGEQRNFAKSLCKGKYIFTIDADEIPSLFLIKNINQVIQSGADGYLLPRIHFVKNLPINFPMPLNEKGWIAWPDYQLRIFKNRKDIYWANPVHEQIINATKIEKIPDDNSDNNLDLIEKYALTEKKNFKKWSKAHRFYLNCYKDWLISSIQNKDFHRAIEIICANPHGHLTFLLDEGMKNIILPEKYEFLASTTKSILSKTKISKEDIINVINTLR